MNPTNTADFADIHDFTLVASDALLFPQATFMYDDKNYTLTPCRNSRNRKVSYWISCQDYTVALYAFSVLIPTEASKMLEDEGALLSFVSMFEANKAHAANEADASRDPKSHMKAAPFTFNDGDEMLVAINNIDDFYNPDTETYVFAYNDCGSIAVYTGISPEEATKLAKEAEEADDYWGAFLGAGGSIYDDPSYPGFNEGQVSNLDFCEQHFNEGKWFAASDWLNADYRPKEKAHE